MADLVRQIVVALIAAGAVTSIEMAYARAKKVAARLVELENGNLEDELVAESAREASPTSARSSSPAPARERGWGGG